MKKLCIKIAVLCVLVAISILGIIVLLPFPEHWYNFALIDKHRILETTPSPKLVLAGGSNLAFGIDSAALASAFDMPVVNAGLHAGLGLGRILDDVSPFLKNGDVLLIVPEYGHFIRSWNGEESVYEFIFDVRQYRLVRSPYYSLPDNFSGYILNKVSIIKSRFIPPNPHAYSRYGFNIYGDYIQHLSMENQEFAPEKYMGAVNHAYLAQFFRFVDHFTAQGIVVALSYPSYEEQSFHASAKTIAELDAALRSKENLLVISNPESYCFHAALFYDTRYHLNAAGRQRRTTQLITDFLAGRT
ncbi:MAG: hypothetical protein LBD20_01405 [Spirochaetaceae bacterium]|jgi:hypothetical protein|nr:hypothetical protein [Spirochaetaceae bacterium]